MVSSETMIPATIGLIGDIGGPELLLIFVLVLLLFGGQRLPDFARGLGKSIREFKKATSGVEDEIRRAMAEPVRPIPPPPPAPVGSTDQTHDSSADYHGDYYHHEPPQQDSLPAAPDLPSSTIAPEATSLPEEKAPAPPSNPAEKPLPPPTL